MTGLLVLILGPLCFWLIYKLLLSRAPIFLKAAVLVAGFLAMTADAIYGRVKFRDLCAKEGGLRVLRTIPDVEGFYNDRARPYQYWIKEHGYRFVEGVGDHRSIDRLTLMPDGTISRERNVTGQSLYAHSYRSGTFGSGYTYGRDIVRDINTDEILGTYTGINYEGGWIERLIAQLGASKGNAGMCFTDDIRLSNDGLVTGVLHASGK